MVAAVGPIVDVVWRVLWIDMFELCAFLIDGREHVQSLVEYGSHGDDRIL